MGALGKKIKKGFLMVPSLSDLLRIISMLGVTGTLIIEGKGGRWGILRFFNGTPFRYAYKEGVEDEEDMILLIPTDMMAYGLGSAILVEISDIPHRARVIEKRKALSASLGLVAQGHFPDAYVQCSVLEQGSLWERCAWSSEG